MLTLRPIRTFDTITGEVAMEHKNHIAKSHALSVPLEQSII